MVKRWSKRAGQAVSGQVILITLAAALIYFGVVGAIHGVKWVYHEADNFIMHVLGKPPVYGVVGKDQVKFTKEERACYPYLEYLAGISKKEPKPAAQAACSQIGDQDRLIPKKTAQMLDKALEDPFTPLF